MSDNKKDRNDEIWKQYAMNNVDEKWLLIQPANLLNIFDLHIKLKCSRIIDLPRSKIPTKSFQEIKQELLLHKKNLKAAATCNWWKIDMLQIIQISNDRGIGTTRSEERRVGKECSW